MNNVIIHKITVTITVSQALLIINTFYSLQLNEFIQCMKNIQYSISRSSITRKSSYNQTYQMHMVCIEY